MNQLMNNSQMTEVRNQLHCYST